MGYVLAQQWVQLRPEQWIPPYRAVARRLSLDPPVILGGERGVTRRCPGQQENQSCRGTDSGCYEGHLAGAPISWASG